MIGREGERSGEGRGGGEAPGAAGFAGDGEFDALAGHGGGDGLDEEGENGVEPEAIVERGGADGIADLLLVVPVFGVVARGVEPLVRPCVASPGDGEERGGVRVKRGDVSSQLGTSETQEIGEDAGAEALGGGDPRCIEPVEEGIEIGGGRGEEMAVATDGEQAELGVENVGRDVVDGPTGASGGAGPVGGGQGIEQREKLLVQRCKQMGGLDHLYRLQRRIRR